MELLNTETASLRTSTLDILLTYQMAMLRS